MYEHYNGLIFDMDGTLLDTESMHREAWHRVFEQFSLTFADTQLEAMNGSPVLHIAQVILHAQPCLLSPSDLVAAKSAIFQKELIQHVRPLPLMSLVINEYGRRPLALGTGSSRRQTEMLLEQLNIRHYFSAIVTADDVEHHKPAPDTFLRCAELMGIPPAACLVFEDADFGIRAAASAGMDVVDVRQL